MEEGFGLSEACHEPVFFSIRIRACHMRGTLRCKDNVRPAISMLSPLGAPGFSLERINLPPFTYAMEAQKFEAACRPRGATSSSAGSTSTLRGRRTTSGSSCRAGSGTRPCAGSTCSGWPTSTADAVPLLVLNALHPLVPEELLGFLRASGASSWWRKGCRTSSSAS